MSLLLEDANQDISAQIATDVVIIEDEPLIAMDLEHLVEGLGHRVVRVARTERQAIEAVKEARPGLVLADIQLADGSSGLDAVNEFLQIVSVPVIFVTAYPERLLTGTKPEPTFLVSKPFSARGVEGRDQPGSVLRRAQPREERLAVGLDRQRAAQEATRARPPAASEVPEAARGRPGRA